MRTIAMLIAAAISFYVLLGVLLFFMQERMVFLAHLPGRQLEAPSSFCMATRATYRIASIA